MLKFLYVSSQGEEEDDVKALGPPGDGGGKWPSKVWGMGNGDSE